ncbi:hypothetical protein HF086_008229 [Spodoptera exigua]|uniref:Bridge-like lipid transfer protein family member 1 C-terminal domain-containing protein n=1 Tax=Spodoptera exigua TaxID=7107 RepID=A0A922MHV6_SPOEX|nr:hypothetical protein HF086_008229 [Spodoptera exigua]
MAEAGAAQLPAEAAVWLPGVHVAGRVLEQRGAARRGGAVLRAGRYVAASADIGLFEHTLSTDLLNHLVFVQKVFMKEVNEVVQKVYGGEKPVPLWNEEEASTSALSRILFSLTIRIKRIQLTATTPSNSAVRLETGAVEFEISNRVQNVQQPTEPHEVRLFARAQVDVNLSLGQLIRNAMFEEAEPEFQQYAFFNTRISMRNAFQDEMVCGDDKEVVLINLKRPLIYIQPVAVDKAILVWLNYKNAYEYWNEKRLNLNKEVLTATQQVFEKVQLTSQITTPHLSTLFLQLNVDDIGICLPLNQPPMARWGLGRGAWGAWCGEGEARGAVVVTLESTHIGACSSGALVSKGRFVGLCLRFADDFEASLDDWKPRADEPSLNVCCVSEGTYEVCSRTTAAKHNDDEADNSKDSQESIILRRKYTDHLPAFVFDTSIDAKKRSKLIEKEMNEQAKIINDLRTLGASHTTIEYEMKRLHDLEALVFKDFRRDMIQKLRRQSVRASSITKGKLGLGSNRSKSFVVPSPPQERKDFESAIEPNLTMSPGVGDSGETLLLGDEDNRLADIIEGGSWSSMESEPLTGKANKAKTAEPNIDFELDVKVYINSGKCVLHTKEPSKEDDSIKIGRMRVGRSASGGLAEGAAPGAGSGAGGSSPPGARRKPAHARHLPVLDLTVFRVPGLDLKVQYIPTYAASLRMRATCPCSTSPCSACPASTSRYSISRPTPQACACAPPARARPHRVPRARPRPQGTVYPDLRRKPAHARHLPVLDLTVFRVPGLDLKVQYIPTYAASLRMRATCPCSTSPCSACPASTSRYSISRPTPQACACAPPARARPHRVPRARPRPQGTVYPDLRRKPAHARHLPVLDLTVFRVPGLDLKVHYESKTLPEESTSPQTVPSLPPLNVGPRKVGIKKAALFAWITVQSIPEETIISPHILEEMSEPAVAMGGLSVTGCLADFSVNMFHPYGGKKSSLKEAQWSPLSDTERKDSLSINVEFVKFHLSRSRKLDFQTDQDQSKATVRFSTIVDVGSASFKYDMRRLGEILAFPKAWYRRTIVRRMFLGDLSLHDTRDHGRPSSSNAPVSPVLPQREKTKTVDHQKPKAGTESTKSGVQGAASVGAAWETLVLFAVNFTKLNVHMNMGNVMGNVSLCPPAVHIEEEAGCNPGHVCGVRLAALELRLEYMGTPVLLARVSALRARATDEWLARARAPRPRPHPPTSRYLPTTALSVPTLSPSNPPIRMPTLTAILAGNYPDSWKTELASATNPYVSKYDARSPEDAAETGRVLHAAVQV